MLLLTTAFPSISWWWSLPIGLGVGIVIASGWLFFQLCKRALGFTDEASQVSACADEIERHYANDVSLAAIRDSAAHGSTVITVRTPLPITALTLVAAAIVADNLDLGFRLLLLEVAGLVIIPFASSIIDAHADVIIQRALVEHTRRQACANELPALRKPIIEQPTLQQQRAHKGLSLPQQHKHNKILPRTRRSGKRR